MSRHCYPVSKSIQKLARLRSKAKECSLSRLTMSSQPLRK